MRGTFSLYYDFSSFEGQNPYLIAPNQMASFLLFVYFENKDKDGGYCASENP
jgi:hypothetical protein